MDTDRLSLLADARDRLVTALGDSLCAECGAGDPRVLPGLVRELRAVLSEIDKIPGSGEVTPLDRLADGIEDELKARRVAREAG